MSYPCPLCGRESREMLFKDMKREFFRCHRCGLVFVPPEYHLPENKEKERYDLHENTPGNPGYMKFLTDFADKTLGYVKAPGNGLDFGSGPEPVLAGILRERGFNMSVYDPFYAPDERVFQNQYQLITLVEVIEHLKDPLNEVRRLTACLKPGGIISIRTKMMPQEDEGFRSWSYKNDMTHICFFSRGTFRRLAREVRCSLKFPAPDMVLMFRI